MGSAFGCGGDRNSNKKSFKTQVKLQEVLGNITLQQYEMYIKRFCSNGTLSLLHMQEMLSFYQLQSKDNHLLVDIFHNPFFHH